MNGKHGQEFCKKALAIKEKYQLPVNQNTLVLEEQYALILAMSGKAKVTIERLSAYIEELEPIKYDMPSTIGGFYLARGCIRKRIWENSKAQEDIEKAKECFRLLSPEDNRREIVEDLLENPPVLLVKKM